jgi:hypothetical protein
VRRHDKGPPGVPPRATEAGDGAGKSEDRAFGEALLGSARVDVAPADMEARILRELSRRTMHGKVQGTMRRERGRGRAWGRGASVAAVALGAAGAALLVFRGHRSSAVDIVADMPLPSVGSSSSSVSAAPSAVVDACAHPVRARGDDPTIDDFEDGDGAVLARDGRQAAWYIAKDSDPPGTSYPTLPSLRPEPAPGNRFALHARGDELRDWGASIEIKLTPPCYDASAYAGIAFSARGPGRIYLAAREVRIVGVEYGGTCTHDCYNAHVRKVDLDAGWRRFEVPWRDMRQRGYEMPPLDPRRLHSVTFQVHAEDTPYDLWIDDVELLTR